MGADPNAQLGASARWAQLDSNLPGYDRDVATVGLNARLMFQGNAYLRHPRTGWNPVP
jgi:hypothetical protein